MLELCVLCQFIFVLKKVFLTFQTRKKNISIRKNLLIQYFLIILPGYLFYWFVFIFILCYVTLVFKTHAFFKKRLPIRLYFLNTNFFSFPILSWRRFHRRFRSACIRRIPDLLRTAPARTSRSSNRTPSFSFGRLLTSRMYLFF